MKKYRALVPIGMIALMIVSLYTLSKGRLESERKYNAYLSEARGYAEDGITKYAIYNYKKALEMKSSTEIYVEVAEYYKNQGDREYLKWCEDFFDKYPASVEAYDCLLGAYYAEKNYIECVNILNVAKKRNISSDYMKQIFGEIKYSYKIGYDSYEEVAAYSGEYCPVFEDGYWTYADMSGGQAIGSGFISAGAFNTSGFAPVIDYEGAVYFIDNTGDKVKVSKQECQSIGPLFDNMAAALKTDGKYVYLDDSLNFLFGTYDYASAVNNGVAVVKNGDCWQLINSEGNDIVSEKYVDVKIDETQTACRNERIFVSTSPGKYIMVDVSGRQVGNQEFEDARLFIEDAPAAVKINGKWCFVDSSGNLISDKKYDDARSFSNGMAAVCTGDKWGFVDLEENLVIEPEFEDAKDFNNAGGCFVKVDGRWRLLKLYYFEGKI